MPSRKFDFKTKKFVDRTAEEIARLEQLKAEQAACDPAPVRKRAAREENYFARVNVPQIGKLAKLEPICWPVFVILRLEEFRRGKPSFTLPTDWLSEVKGLSRTTLRRALIQLEACGLIAIARKAPLTPIITILNQSVNPPADQ